MRKKILVAEQSDATRSVAETILRQNGFEVVAVTESGAAVEVIEHGHPDLVLVGVELVHENTPLYKLATSRSAGHRTPVLVFAEAGREVPGMAAELVIPRPFHPRDLLDRVMAFAGRGVEVRAGNSKGPPLGDISDDLLDNALGMGGTGSIDVTESEVMNQTRRVDSTQKPRRNEDLETLGHGHGEDEEAGQTGRIESIMISEESTDIRRPETGKVKRPATNVSDEGGGLDILPNQYGIGEPGSFNDDSAAGGDPTHDYHWFVSEMQREASVPPEKQREAGTTKPVQPTEELTFTDPASTLEKFNPATHISQKGEKVDSGGVERFIDEFKREIERFNADEPESLTLREEPTREPRAASWEEVVESITPDRVALFTRQLATELAERIAEKIVGKLDADKLAHLIKAEVIAQLRTRRER